MSEQENTRSKKSYLFQMKEKIDNLSISTQFKRFICAMLGFILVVIITLGGVALFSDIPKEYILILVPGIGWLIGQVFLKNKEIEQKHIEKKMEAYQKFINEFIDSMTIDKDNSNRAEKMVKTMLDFKKAVLVWGKPETIQGFILFQNELNALTKNNPNATLAFCRLIDSLFKLIRKDLGHNDSKLKKLELAQICMTDNLEELQKAENNPCA